MAVAKPRMTEEELMRLATDGRKFELVDGEVREVPTSFEYDQIVIRMGHMMYPFAEDYGDLTGSQAGFRMKDGNIRCPDLGFTRFEKLPDGEIPKGFADFAPDLCIEIISPTEEPGDMGRKLGEYFASGAQQVWHLFPDKRRVTVYRSATESHDYGPEDDLDAGASCPASDAA